MHRPVRFKHAAQGSEPRVRVREMMQNPSAHDLIEGHPQIVYTLDGKLVDLEIIKLYFLLSPSVQRTLVALKSMPVT